MSQLAKPVAQVKPHVFAVHTRFALARDGQSSAETQKALEPVDVAECVGGTDDVAVVDGVHVVEAEVLGDDVDVAAGVSHTTGGGQLHGAHPVGVGVAVGVFDRECVGERVGLEERVRVRVLVADAARCRAAPLPASAASASASAAPPSTHSATSSASPPWSTNLYKENSECPCERALSVSTPAPGRESAA